MKPSVELCLINGVEGGCISLNDYRIAGPKPWGGGRVQKSWTVEIEDLIRAIPGLSYNEQSEKENPKT